MRILNILAWLLLSASMASAQASDPSTDGTIERAPAQAAAEKPPPSGAELARAQRRYRHEPTVGAVVRALRAASRGDRSASLAARARAAGWVPRLTLRARRGQAVDISAVGSDEQLKLSTDDDLMLEASLVFELDRVVFRREEVALERQAQAARIQQRRLEREVVGLYFERRRLQLERDLLGQDGPEHALRIAEIEALLDIFTNDAFTRMLVASPWKTAEAMPATRRPSSPKSSSTGASSKAKPATSPKAASR
ncbi:MAG: hypothetical protein OEZ06_30715 [Myxococcales bacterium]|nr:hypothetical protein [Myxococcales bacterium]